MKRISDETKDEIKRIEERLCGLADVAWIDLPGCKPYIQGSAVTCNHSDNRKAHGRASHRFLRAAESSFGFTLSIEKLARLIHAELTAREAKGESDGA